MADTNDDNSSPTNQPNHAVSILQNKQGIYKTTTTDLTNVSKMNQ